MERQGHGAARAVVLAFAVARVLDVLVAVFADQGDKAETVSEEFVGQYGGVLFHFDEVDGHRGDFGEHYSAEGVGESEVDRGEFKVNASGFGLLRF